MRAPGPDADYRQARGLRGGPRLLAWLLIAGLHAGALAGLASVQAEPEPQRLPGPLLVSLISAPPEPPPPPTLITPPPPRPKPQLVASTRPAPAAIETPPVEETPPPEPAAEPPPPADPAPPAEPALLPPDFVAAHLDNPGPKYPQASRQLREEGQVLLRVLVNAQGLPEQVLLERSSGWSRLDEAAARVVRERWRFVPARRGEQALAAWVLVPIIFELKK